MIVTGIFLFIISGFVTTSSSSNVVVHREIYASEKFWFDHYFLKFFSPSGRNYYIDYRNGEIFPEKMDSGLQDVPGEMESELEDVKEDVNLPYMPYIRFVSLNLKVFDIYFETQGHNYIPHVVETKLILEDKTTFIRHSLHSFVGPDNQIYRLSYDNNNSDIRIALEEPAKILNHLQIKTLGAYSKWEHTYDFSKNGDNLTDISLSPVDKFSTILPEMEANTLKDRNLLMINFSTPIGKKYLITNDLNIASVHGEDDGKQTSESSIVSSLTSVYSFFSTAIYGEDNGNNLNEPYISFVEPDDRIYDIHFGSNDQPQIELVEVQEDKNKNIFNSRDLRLLSFVGPNKKLYHISRTNATGYSIPTIDSSPSQSSDVQLTIVEISKYYKKCVKFIFTDDGKELFNRVDEIDSTLLSESPPLQLDEVEASSEFAMSSFLTFNSPSGKNYYISPNGTMPNIAVEMGNNNPQPSYITFRLQDGRWSHIYFTPGDVPSLKIDSVASDNSTTTFSLKSFVTPDKKSYQIGYNYENDISEPFIVLSSPKDPFDEQLEGTLKIKVASFSREYFYHFSWTGDKLVQTSTNLLRRLAPNVLKSLVG